MMAIHTTNHTWNHKSFLFYLFYYSTYRQIYVTIYKFDTTRDKLRGGKGRASMRARHRQQEGGDRDTHRGKGVGGSEAMWERTRESKSERGGGRAHGRGAQGRARGCPRA
jgi:hypothetical protein